MTYMYNHVHFLIVFIKLLSVSGEVVVLFFCFNDSDHSLIHPDFYTQPITGHLLYCVIMILGSYICGKRVLGSQT